MDNYIKSEDKSLVLPEGVVFNSSVSKEFYDARVSIYYRL